ncbi:MAG: tetratricopeptide repeat protein [Blastocatellia bacterium]|nr:tetratricopeptide repeat protein [Blastocatellia bacterium]
MFGTKFITLAFTFILTAAIIDPGIAAQQTGKRLEPIRDPALETFAKHNLEVARWNITRRKAFEGARDRLQEIIDTYPDFSRMDEVLYWMGEAHLKLNKNEEAVDYYKKLLKEYPGSEFTEKARARLAELKVEPDKEGNAN